MLRGQCPLEAACDWNMLKCQIVGLKLPRYIPCTWGIPSKMGLGYDGWTSQRLEYSFAQQWISSCACHPHGSAECWSQPTATHWSWTSGQPLTTGNQSGGYSTIHPLHIADWLCLRPGFWLFGVSSCIFNSSCAVLVTGEQRDHNIVCEHYLWSFYESFPTAAVRLDMVHISIVVAESWHMAGILMARCFWNSTFRASDGSRLRPGDDSVFMSRSEDFFQSTVQKQPSCDLFKR